MQPAGGSIRETGRTVPPEQPNSIRPDADVARETAVAFGRALTSGEVDAFLALLTPDVDYEAPSATQGTVVKLTGHEEVRRYVEQTVTEYTEVAVEIKETRDLGGGRFLIIGRQDATPRAGTTPIATPVGSVLDIRDGKVARVRAFFDVQMAVDAAGVDPPHE